MSTAMSEGSQLGLNADRIDVGSMAHGGGPNASWVRALEMTGRVARSPLRTLSAVIDDHARYAGDASALICDGRHVSYRELAAAADRYARWALGEGMSKGDTVALLMLNQPEFMAIWLGVTKVGCTIALINTNLRGPSLAHSIDIVKPRHVIADARVLSSLLEAQSHLKVETKIWQHGEGPGDFPRIETSLVELSCDADGALESRCPQLDDTALYIYTSGTTGLPKAAKVSHRRVMLWSYWLAGMMDMRPTDRMYNCLPMYHSIGGVAAPGALLVTGGSVVIRERFSARNFWHDVVTYDCTLFQYIGELCRYLVNSPAVPHETQHRLRICCGNGMGVDVWKEFQHRFKIPRILEFYAATEGNISLYNVEGMPGAIGRVPLFLAHRFPLRLVKIDPVSGQPMRDERGRCESCGINEVGEALGRISRSPGEPGSGFEGYTGRDESLKKVLRDVVEPGDAWFRSGDLMRKDANGYYYFVDRLGDTFRWKGENVATMEVAQAIAAFPGVREATVYGVTIPGHEGRAGMAAIATDDEIKLAALHEYLAVCLPGYARPLFLRVMEAIEVTSTFKHVKADLVRQGYDPSAVSDAIYVDHPERGAFVPLDASLFERIQTRSLRF
jgi:fatty-acyl-CoA synthase